MEIPQVQQVLQVPDALDAVSIEKRAPEQRGLIEAVALINKSELLGQDKEMTFQMDRDTGRPVIRVVNRQTREVVQQIPAEYVLNVAKALEQSRFKPSGLSKGYGTAKLLVPKHLIQQFTNVMQVATFLLLDDCLCKGMNRAEANAMGQTIAVCGLPPLQPTQATKDDRLRHRGQCAFRLTQTVSSRGICFKRDSGLPI